MQPIKLKVCGMRDSSNIREVASVHPDFMGFIFYQKSPRYVGLNFKIPDNLDVSIQRVGVFVNEKVKTIIELVTKHSLDFVQLHGDESLEECQELKRNGIKTMKVFSIDNAFDFEGVAHYQPYADYVLFDTLGKARGGNGVPFDWHLLKKYKGDVPFLLSGGIDPENISQVKKLNHDQLFAIDVNSGVESAPGVKDLSKLNRLIKNFKT
ncbi:MAG: phosphoribosylanthranilate isomerase [Cyclobacteriaceae bacterium]|nr:phosphoribosylanthranilate isomerase [Cyclobacteriaceae bacterium]